MATGRLADITLTSSLDTTGIIRDVQNVAKQLPAIKLKIDSQPLGTISRQASEFQKSLQAAQSRVLAFSATAGQIYALSRAFEAVVRSTIDVEKSLKDINVILGLSSKELAKFSDELFKVASETGQSFKVAADAATELSRQGLSASETLKRVRDALTLTRLSGLDVVSSVTAITTALNSFNEAALDSTSIINKLASVDAQFAVSSKDLADSLSRVGSTAKDVGVNFDELIGLVTAAKQITGREGSVIGNSLKTIFQRIERPEVIDNLKQLGVLTEDLSGKSLSAKDVLTNLAKSYKDLSSAQQNQVIQLAAGVFQANQFRAILSDLAKQNSITTRATEVSTNASDAAAKRQAELNKTLSANINETINNLTNLASKAGKITFEPVIKRATGLISYFTEGLSKDDSGQKNAETVGGTVGVGFLKGIGNYLSGPGLGLASALLIKFFTSFASYSVKSLSQIIESSTKRYAIEQSTEQLLARQPELIGQILKLNGDQIKIRQLINQELVKELALLNQISATKENISSNVSRTIFGIPIQNKPFTINQRDEITSNPRFKAVGLVPQIEEKVGALQGGYKPGEVKELNVPKLGKVYYNTAEKVKYFPGMSQPAIIPPLNSKAGINYKKEFTNSHGFDPYKANGLIPNYALKDFVKNNKASIGISALALGAIVGGFGYEKYQNNKLNEYANRVPSVSPVFRYSGRFDAENKVIDKLNKNKHLIELRKRFFEGNTIPVDIVQSPDESLGGLYAKGTDKTISLNANYGGGYKDGYGGINESAFFHELGHKIADQKLGPLTSSKLNKAIIADKQKRGSFLNEELGVSVHGDSHSESFAEIFAMAMSGKTNWTAWGGKDNKTWTTNNIADLDLYKVMKEAKLVPNYADIKISPDQIKDYLMGARDWTSIKYQSKSLGGIQSIRSAQHSSLVKNDEKVGADAGPGYKSWMDRQLKTRTINVRGIFGDNDKPEIKAIKWDAIKEFVRGGDKYTVGNNGIIPDQFKDWESYGNFLIGYRGIDEQREKKSLRDRDAFASEGVGLYLSRTKELASHFGDIVKQITFPLPSKAIETNGRLPILGENEIFLDDKKYKDPWLKINKLAGKNLGINENNFNELTKGPLQRELTKLLLKRGYDSVHDGEWMVLLDKTLRGKSNGLVPNYSSKDLLNSLKNIEFPNVQYLLTKRGKQGAYLHYLEAKEKGKGAGGEFMRSLIELADTHKTNLSLTPFANDSNGGLDQEKLIKFYQKYGFTEGKTPKFGLPEMVRKYKNDGIVPNYALSLRLMKKAVKEFKTSGDGGNRIYRRNDIGAIAQFFPNEIGKGDINIPKGSSSETVLHEIGHIMSFNGVNDTTIERERFANSTALEMARRFGNGSGTDVEKYKQFATEQIKNYKLGSIRNALTFLSKDNSKTFAENSQYLRNVQSSNAGIKELNAAYSGVVRDLIKDYGISNFRDYIKQKKQDRSFYERNLGSPAFYNGSIPNYAYISPSIELGDVLGNGGFKTVYNVKSIANSNLSPDKIVAATARKVEAFEDFEILKSLNKRNLPFFPQFHGIGNIKGKLPTGAISNITGIIEKSNVIGSDLFNEILRNIGIDAKTNTEFYGYQEKVAQSINRSLPRYGLGSYPATLKNGITITGNLKAGNLGYKSGNVLDSIAKGLFQSELTGSSAILDSLIAKVLDSGDLKILDVGGINTTPRKRIPVAAGGIVPNINALTNAVYRENKAGIPLSQIRVGSNPIIKSAQNPLGLGVYNTKDEPGGLIQGIQRVAAMGLDPKKAGVPNFAAPPEFEDSLIPQRLKESVARDLIDIQSKLKSGAINLANALDSLKELDKSTKLTGQSFANFEKSLKGIAISTENSRAGTLKSSFDLANQKTDIKSLIPYRNTVRLSKAESEAISIGAIDVKSGPPSQKLIGGDFVNFTINSRNLGNRGNVLNPGFTPRALLPQKSSASPIIYLPEQFIDKPRYGANLLSYPEGTEKDLAGDVILKLRIEQDKRKLEQTLLARQKQVNAGNIAVGVSGESDVLFRQQYKFEGIRGEARSLINKQIDTYLQKLAAGTKETSDEMQKLKNGIFSNVKTFSYTEKAATTIGTQVQDILRTGVPGATILGTKSRITAEREARLEKEAEISKARKQSIINAGLNVDVTSGVETTRNIVERSLKQIYKADISNEEKKQLANALKEKIKESQNIALTKEFSDRFGNIGLNPFKYYQAQKFARENNLTESGRNLRQSLQGRALNASFVLPVLGGIAEQAIGDETLTQRRTAGAITGLTNIASFSATGFGIGGAVGAGIGAGIGILTEVPAFLKKFSDTLPDLKRRLEEVTNESQRVSTAFGTFLSTSEKITGIDTGEIKATVGQRRGLERERQLALSNIPIQARRRIVEAVKSGDFAGAADISDIYSRIPSQENSLIGDIAGLQANERLKQGVGFGRRLSTAYKASGGGEGNLFTNIGAGITGLSGALASYLPGASREEYVVKAIDSLKSEQERQNKKEFDKSTSAIAKSLLQFQNNQGQSLINILSEADLNKIQAGAKSGNTDFITEIFGQKGIDTSKITTSINELGDEYRKSLFEQIAKVFDKNYIQKLKDDAEEIQKANQRIIRTFDDLNSRLAEASIRGKAEANRFENEVLKSFSRFTTDIQTRGIERQAGNQIRLISRGGSDFTRNEISYNEAIAGANDALAIDLSKLEANSIIQTDKIRKQFEREFRKNTINDVRNNTLLNQNPESINAAVERRLPELSNVFNALKTSPEEAVRQAQLKLKQLEKESSTTISPLFTQTAAALKDSGAFNLKDLQTSINLSGNDKLRQKYSPLFNEIGGLSDKSLQSDLLNLNIDEISKKSRTKDEIKLLIDTLTSFIDKVTDIIAENSTAISEANNQAESTKKQAKATRDSSLNVLRKEFANTLSISAASNNLTRNIIGIESQAGLSVSRNIFNNELAKRRVGPVQQVDIDLQSQLSQLSLEKIKRDNSNLSTILTDVYKNEKFRGITNEQELLGFNKNGLDEGDIKLLEKAQEDLNNAKKISLDLDIKSRQEIEETAKQQKTLAELTLRFTDARVSAQRNINRGLAEGGKSGRDFSDVYKYSTIRDTISPTLQESENDQVARTLNNLQDAGTDFRNSIKQAFAEAATGSSSLGEAMRNAGLELAKGITSRATQQSIDLLFGATFGTGQKGQSLLGGGESGYIGSLISSIGSYFTGAKNKGGYIPRYSSGGYVNMGSGVKDDVPAFLTGGEFVLNKKAVNKIGKHNLDSINFGGNVKKLAVGGSASINLLNTFNVDNNKFETDPNLSAFALTDENNPQNNLKFQREQYSIEKKNYYDNYALELRKFRKQQDTALKMAYINAGIQVVAGGISQYNAGNISAQNTAFSAGEGPVSANYAKSLNYAKPYSYQSNLGRITTGGTSFGSYSNSIKSYPTVGYYAKGGQVIPSAGNIKRYFANGGYFGGDQSSDRFSALVMGGEYIVNPKTVSQYGTKFFDNLNKSYADGGLVSTTSEKSDSINNLINKLLEVNQEIKNVLSDKNNNKNNDSSENKTISNISAQPIYNITVNTTLNSNGGVNASSTVESDNGNGKEDDREKAKKLNEIIKNKVIEGITQESLSGGVLYEKFVTRT